MGEEIIEKEIEGTIVAVKAKKDFQDFYCEIEWKDGKVEIDPNIVWKKILEICGVK